MAARRILKKLEETSDKCCTNTACTGNSTDPGMPDVFTFVQSVNATMVEAVGELGGDGYV